MSVSFCLPHPVAVSAFMICRGLCACTEMLWMCVLYVSFGSTVRRRTNIPTDPHAITTTDIKTNMRHIHLSIVSRHLVTRGNNKILRTPPPHISSSEEILPCLSRRTLAQLKTNKSPFLKSYLHKVDATCILYLWGYNCSDGLDHEYSMIGTNDSTYVPMLSLENTTHNNLCASDLVNGICMYKQIISIFIEACVTNKRIFISLKFHK